MGPSHPGGIAGSFVLRRGGIEPCPGLANGLDVAVGSDASSNGKSTGGRCRMGESSFAADIPIILVFIDRLGTGGGGLGAAAARNLLAERDRRRVDGDDGEFFWAV